MSEAADVATVDLSCSHRWGKDWSVAHRPLVWVHNSRTQSSGLCWPPVHPLLSVSAALS